MPPAAKNGMADAVRSGFSLEFSSPQPLHFERIERRQIRRVRTSSPPSRPPSVLRIRSSTSHRRYEPNTKNSPGAAPCARKTGDASATLARTPCRFSPPRTAALGSRWRRTNCTSSLSCASGNARQRAMPKGQKVFSPPYTPPEKMIGFSFAAPFENRCEISGSFTPAAAVHRRCRECGRRHRSAADAPRARARARPRADRQAC